MGKIPVGRIANPSEGLVRNGGRIGNPSYGIILSESATPFMVGDVIMDATPRFPQQAAQRETAIMALRLLFVVLASILALPATAADRPKAPKPDGNRLTYLDEINPWYPNKDFPRLTTPQWVGEKGVEAVVILAIDDMRDPAKYERFLRPILNRLKKIDGRAAMSIMTCNVKPDDKQLQTWLDEGVSLECHTIDHPCPLLAGGDFKKAKSTYDRCVDLMNQIPRNKPVAFRTPCCDSLNTVSPRFYTEIFNRWTPSLNSLQIDSSVFNFFTSADKSIPRKLVLDKDGKERFLKYLPRNLKRGGHVHNHFVNYIENYPYPYVIGNTCWQFPCVAPSDWSAQHLHGKNNPQTVADWKAALDITVKKQGVFCLVFHPHGWIKAEQVEDLIDHAVKTHGRKVKFLNFREAAERLNRNLGTRLLEGEWVRDPRKEYEASRILDIDNDGHMDAMYTQKGKLVARMWRPGNANWKTIISPFEIGSSRRFTGTEVRFGVLDKNGKAAVAGFVALTRRPDGLDAKKSGVFFWTITRDRWSQAFGLPPQSLAYTLNYFQLRLRDLDGDGISEFLQVGALPTRRALFASRVSQFSQSNRTWTRLFGIPWSSRFPDGFSWEGLRFVDLNGDGRDDIVFSNHQRYGVWLFKDMKSGWSVEVLNVKRNATAKPQAVVLPPIVRRDGTNNGFFVHGRYLCWQNEDTDTLPDLIYRVSFDDVVGQAFQPDRKGRKTLKAKRRHGQAGKPDLRPKPLSPEMSLKVMQPRPGFQVQLVAAEPLVRDPVAFEWGPDGRLWVAEMADYPVGQAFQPDRNGRKTSKAQGRPGQAGKPDLRRGGRVRVLEDTNGDGVYDKSTLFLDGLNFPNGVLPWRKGVLITAAPDIIYAEDTNGDGKADVKRVLFTGFGQGNQQHRANGLVRGLDNWIYCANGESDGRITSTKTGQVVDIRGRDFRFNPDTGELQTVTGRTQFGRNRDDWGNWFGNNNSNPLYHFVLDDRYLARNPHVRYPDPRVQVSVRPGAAAVFPVSKAMPRFNDYHTLNRFTSACSAIIYRDTLFGPAFAGNSFVSEPVHNLVHREIVKPAGVTFTSRRADDERRSEFLASRDNWFRPTMLKTGPDGALYIADMYRLVIEHPQYIPKELQKDWDFRAGENLGRIYRVFPKGKKLRRIPRLDRMTTAQLVAALGDTNGWVRDTAQRLLIDRNDRSAVPLLERLAGERPASAGRSARRNALARLHALCTLDGLRALKPSVIAIALSDPHPGVRRHAVRLAERQLNTSPELAAKVAKLAGDRDPLVRMQVAYSLGEWNDAKSGEVLATLLRRDGGNRYITAAALSSVNAKNLGTLVAAMLGKTPVADASASPVGPVLSLAAAMGGKRTLLDVLQRITRPIDPKQPAGKWKFHVRQIAALTAFHGGLQSRGQSLRKLISSAKKPAAERLEVQVGRLYLFATQTAFAQGNGTRIAERLVAVRSLPLAADFENNDGNMALGCRELLIPQEDARVQAAVVDALARLNHPNVPKTLLRDWKSHTPSLRTEIVDALLGRRSWTRALLTAIRKGDVRPAEISAVHRQRLLSLRNRELRQLAADVLKSVRFDANRAKVVAAYQSALKLTGNVSHGKAVFKKTCSICHKLEGVGKQVGPDLIGLKDKSPQSLLVAILDPNRNVESRYVNYVAVTKAGRSFAGLLASEAGGSITLVGPDGKEQVLLRGEIELLRSTAKSAMPEGLEKDLKPQDAADVMAYVASVKSDLPQRKPNGRFPRTIRPRKDGSFTLAADDCEIYGPSLKFEAKHNNLGWWGSPRDRAVWPVYVPAEQTYAVQIEFACDAKNAGNAFVLECGRNTLTAKIPSTGGWDTYRKRNIGTITLPAGQQRIAARAGGGLKGYLFDLKSVRLTPVRK
jgi:putative membrane-bound dehydrogenase-like protein